MGHAESKWIGLALIALVAATLLGAVNSYLVTALGSGLSFAAFLGAYWCAWAFGQVVPGQVGDVIGISLFLRRRGISLPVAVGRMGIDKLISLFCQLALTSGLIAIYDVPVPRIAGLLGACAACALLGAYLLSLRRKAMLIGGDGLRGKFIHALHEAHVLIKTRPRVVAVNLLLTLFKLFLIGICYWATFRAFHVTTANLIDVAVTANSAGLVAYIPVSANGLGTVEAGGIYLFGLLGLAPPVVVATYLTLRAANIALACGGTAIVLISSAKQRRWDA